MSDQSQVSAPSPNEIDWTKPVTVVTGTRDDRAEQVHVFDQDDWDAIRVAIAAKRPLLVRGEPGVGKTQLAEAAAIKLGRPLLRKVVDSRTEARDFLWEFDAVMRLADAQAGRLRDSPPGTERSDVLQGDSPAQSSCQDLIPTAAVGRPDLQRYVRPGPLWWAFDWEGACDQHRLTGFPEPEFIRHDDPTDGDDQGDARKCHPENGFVVLVDEIDKGETDVPNGLLEALGSARFSPFGYPKEVVAKHFPLVVITTNEERTLPPAFVRRCLIHILELPHETKQPEEFKKKLVHRARAHFDKFELADAEHLYDKAADLIRCDREVARLNNVLPLPGQAEFFDLLRAVIHLSRGKSQPPMDLLDRVADYAVRKHPSLRKRKSSSRENRGNVP
jgi:MoxR-like ATPase